jgi:hypothetical protein
MIKPVPVKEQYLDVLREMNLSSDDLAEARAQAERKLKIRLKWQRRDLLHTGSKRIDDLQIADLQGMLEALDELGGRWLPLKDGRTMLYVIGAEGHQFVKVGVTEKLKLRLSQLQCGSPFPLHVIWTVLGDYKLEAYLHRTFKECRASGEWFDLGTDPITVITDEIRNTAWGTLLDTQRDYAQVA